MKKEEQTCWRRRWGAPPSLSLMLLLLLAPVVSAAAVLSLTVSSPVTLGADVTLTCLYNTTPPTGPVTWTINGQRISNGSYFAVYNHILEVKGVDESVSGVTRPYQCRASGDISDSIILTLNIPPVVRVQDVTVNESSPAILLCENLHPSDAVDYSWEKEGETLPNEFFADLQLPPVSRTDAGNYTCVAANSFGLTRETGWLAVQYLDLEAVSPPLIAVAGGTPFVQVVCRADSYPSPTFTWTTPPDVPTSFVTFDSNGSVSVLNVSPDGGLRLVHSGLYSCRAENAAKMATVTFRVIVQDFPAMPNRLQVTMVTATSAQLSWRLPHDGNSPVEKYYITVTTTNATSPAQFTITAPGYQNSAAVETLSPASTYQFTVVAENLIGNSSASEPLSFATIGLAPDMPPFNLSLLEVGLRSVVISVEIPDFNAGVSMVTGCVAQYVSEGGVSDQSIACMRGTLIGLCPNMEYNISVAFVNSEGLGPWSRTVGVTTNQGPALSPEVWAAVEGPSTVRVQLGLREDACYDREQLLFTVQYQGAGQGEGQWTTVLSRASLPTNEYLVVGLQPSTQYRFRVGVTSGNGQLALGVSPTVMTLIGAPPTPDFIPPDTLVWSQNDQAAVMYFVLILEAEDDVIVGLLNTSDTALSLIGLQDGRQYRARVRGVSQIGAEGPWSEFVFFTVPQPPNTGAVSGDVDKVEAIVIGATLGALLCVVAVAMGIGIVAVFYRLKHRDTHSLRPSDRRLSTSTLPDAVALSVGRSAGQKAGHVPYSAPHHHHVHFAFDKGHTVTSLSPPHYTADTAGMEGEVHRESPPFAVSASADDDSLPSVSSMEAGLSEVTPTASGGWGEEPSVAPPTGSGEKPSEAIPVQSVTQEKDEEAVSITSGEWEIRLEPIVCEGEEMGLILQQLGDEVEGLGEQKEELEGGAANKSPGARSIRLKRAVSIESVV